MITADILGERARMTPDATALVYVPTGESFTYAQLDARARGCAWLWREQWGLAPGDRIGLLAENRVEYVDAFWAAGKSGIILVPLSTRATAHELAAIVRDSGIRCLMYSTRYQAIVQELRAQVEIERVELLAWASSN